MTKTVTLHVCDSCGHSQERELSLKLPRLAVFILDRGTSPNDPQLPLCFNQDMEFCSEDCIEALFSDLSSPKVKLA